MRLEKVLFGMVLATCLVLTIAMFVPEAPGGHAVPHPEHSEMLQGGSGTDRLGPVLWIGWVFGLLQSLLFVTLIAFSARERLGSLGPPLLAGLLLHVGLWTWLILAYRDYVLGANHSLYLGFPEPTAILIYGIWPATTVFSLLFAVGFDRWVLSDEDYAAYRRLLATRFSDEEGDVGESSQLRSETTQP